MSQNKPQDRVVQIDLDSPRFSVNQLPTFSPFKVTAITAFERDMKPTQRSPQGWISTNYRVTVAPKSNPKAEIEVLMFKDDFEKIRSLLKLYGGSDHTLLSCELDTSQKPVKRIFTATQV